MLYACMNLWEYTVHNCMCICSHAPMLTCTYAHMHACSCTCLSIYAYAHMCIPASRGGGKIKLIHMHKVTQKISA